MMSNDERPAGARTHSVADERPGFTLTLPAVHASVGVARSAIRRTIRFRDDDSESSFLTAFTEVANNAIEEHQRRQIGDPISVDVTLDRSPVVTVRDRGSGIPARFTSHEIGQPPPVHHLSGRGLTIAKTLVDHIEFSVDDSGTSVTLPLDEFGEVA